MADACNSDLFQPGKLAQNGFIERFNCAYWEELSDAYLFYSLDEARRITVEWLEGHNPIRPNLFATMSIGISLIIKNMQRNIKRNYFTNNRAVLALLMALVNDAGRGR